MSSRDGIDLLVNENVVNSMIEAFMTITESPAEKHGKLIVYLLEAFVNIL